MDELSQNEKNAAMNTMEKTVKTRWLRLNAAAHPLHKDYKGIAQAHRTLKEDPSNAGGATAEGLLTKINIASFLGTLYTINLILPHLSSLSKTLQKEFFNFSRISPSIEKTTKSISIFNIQHFNSLISYFDGILSRCDFNFSTADKEMIADVATKYFNALQNIIKERFPVEVVNALETFDIPNV